MKDAAAVSAVRVRRDELIQSHHKHCLYTTGNNPLGCERRNPAIQEIATRKYVVGGHMHDAICHIYFVLGLRICDLLNQFQDRSISEFNGALLLSGWGVHPRDSHRNTEIVGD